MATAGCRSRISGDLMGWTFSTYDGIAAHGRPSNLRRAMFEIMRAIDERTLALGYPSQYTWWVASSPHRKEHPTFEDLEFLKCTGHKTSPNLSLANRAYQNMVLIKERILQMITTGRFVTTSGGTTKYTQASLEAAIGTTIDNPESVTDARWWQAMQDALDLMIHAWSRLVPIFGTTERSFSDTESTPADAWANRHYVSTSTPQPGAFVSPLVSGWQIGGSGPYTALISSGSSRDFNLSQVNSSIIYGDVQFAEYEYSSTWDAYTGGSFAIDIGSDSIALTGAGSGTLATTPAFMPLGATVSLTATVATAEPSSNPFNRTFPLPDTGSVNISIHGLNLQHDLSSILTDQA